MNLSDNPESVFPAAPVVATRARKILLDLGRPYRIQLCFAFVALITATCTALALPSVFGALIDTAFGQKGSHLKGFINATPSNNQIDHYFLLLLGVVTLMVLSTALRSFSLTWVGERIIADLRKRIFEHVILQSPEFFETTHAGEILSRLIGDTAIIQSAFTNFISNTLSNLMLVTGGGIMLFVISAKLAAIIFGIILVVMIPPLLVRKRISSIAAGFHERVAAASTLANEVLNAVATVQAFKNEPHETTRFKGLIELSFDQAMRLFRASVTVISVSQLLVLGGMVFVLRAGAFAVRDGEMLAGALSEFVIYSVIVGTAIASLSDVIASLQRIEGAAQRLLDVLTSKSSIQSPAAPIALPRRAKQGVEVTLENVCFQYSSRPTPALSDVSLNFAAGETIAIVGTSGAGKTTLFQLLLRFYDTQRGKVTLDGVNVKDIKLDALRDRIGIVLQDTVIFSGNVRDNIRYGRLDASDEDVIAAARLANADEFISALPEGYASFLGDRGVRLSGGQRQRIAIARALLKDPPLLLLDEATNALDVHSEAMVQRAIESAAVGRTTIIIAHRLSTVRRADKIIVLDAGKVIETGTHQELMSAGEKYASLVALQFTHED